MQEPLEKAFDKALTILFCTWFLVAILLSFFIGGLVVFYTLLPALGAWMKMVTLFDIITGPGSLLAFVMSAIGIVMGMRDHEMNPYSFTDPWLIVFLGGGILCMALTIRTMLAVSF